MNESEKQNSAPIEPTSDVSADPYEEKDADAAAYPNEQPENVAQEPSEPVDYEEVVRSDIEQLKTTFSELCDLNDISQLKNPMRYGALRDLGLSPVEAYLATGGRGRTPDTRSHLTSAVPGAARVVSDIPRQQLEAARDLFSDMSDSDIRKLYRRVTK